MIRRLALDPLDWPLGWLLLFCFELFLGFELFFGFGLATLVPRSSRERFFYILNV